jgi:small subunit ribosomal protein S16
LKTERIAYWLGVGAQPSLNVKTLIKKYGPGGTHVEQQRAARDKLALPKVVPDAGEPVYVASATDAEAAAEAPAVEAPAADAPPAEVAETPAEESADTAGDDTASESTEKAGSIRE